MQNELNTQEKVIYANKENVHPKTNPTSLVRNQHNPALHLPPSFVRSSVSSDYLKVSDLSSAPEGFTSRRRAALFGLGRFGLVGSGEQIVEGRLQVIVVIQQGLSGRLTVEAHLHDVPQSSLINLEETAET